MELNDLELVLVGDVPATFQGGHSVFRVRSQGLEEGVLAVQSTKDGLPNRSVRALDIDELRDSFGSALFGS